jgi:hypothetical protein
MNLILKSAVGSVLGLTAVGANALGVPSSDNSDLVLVIQNESTPANVYVLDTGISINSVLGPNAGSSINASDSLNSTKFSGINATVGPSSLLTSFLAANPASGDGWALEAAQYSGATTYAGANAAASKNSGKAYGIFDSTVASGGFASQVQLNIFQGFLNGIFSDYLTPVDGLGLSPLQTATEASSGASYSTAAQGRYGIETGINDYQVPGGAAQVLYALTGNGTTGTVQSYIVGGASLSSSGQLVLTANSTTAVPVPPAVWLFGSGLLGLVGVSRRRKAAV